MGAEISTAKVINDQARKFKPEVLDDQPALELWVGVFNSMAIRLLNDKANYCHSRGLANDCTSVHGFTNQDWENVYYGSLAESSRILAKQAEQEEKEAEARRLKHPGQYFQLFVNHGWREAVCLAIVGQEALIEYTMPKGTTSLRIVKTENPEYLVRNVSYRQVPIKFLRAVVDTGVEWDGQGQRTKRQRSAAETLQLRMEV